MDHTISLIRKSHHGDKEAREQLVKRKCRFGVVCGKEILWERCRAGRFISDREHRTVKSDR